MVREYELRKVCGYDWLVVTVYDFPDDAEPFLIIQMSVDGKHCRFDCPRQTLCAYYKVSDEILRCYQFLDSPHWRNTVACYNRSYVNLPSSGLFED